MQGQNQSFNANSSKVIETESRFLSLNGYDQNTNNSPESSSPISNPRIPASQIQHNYNKFIAILRDSSSNLHHRIERAAIQAQSEEIVRSQLEKVRRRGIEAESDR
jgi:hypothetical protein